MIQAAGEPEATIVHPPAIDFFLASFTFRNHYVFKGIGIAREINTPRQSELLRSESCDLSPALIAGVKGILQEIGRAHV